MATKQPGKPASAARSNKELVGGASQPPKGQQGRACPAQKTIPSGEPWREDWSPSKFYDTMRRLFRRRPDPLVVLTTSNDKAYRFRVVLPVQPPFYHNRPLKRVVCPQPDGSEKYVHEFRGAAELYISWNHSREERRLKQKAASVPILGHPELSRFGIPPEKSWPYIKALGRLHFAETADQQARAKQEVKALAQRGPRALRSVLKELLKGLPQRRRGLTHGKVISEVVRYRTERQFVWAFLRREAMAAFDCSRRGLHELQLEQLEELAKAYSFFKPELTLDQLKRGLGNSHQTDEDVAEEFGLSTKTLRSLLSKHHPLAKSDHT